MNKHPYLHINENLNVNWIRDEHIESNGVHNLKYYSNKNLNLDTNETVVEFIRYHRNYYAFYTNFKNIYENTPNGLVNINMKSDITPTYDQGQYIGYSNNQIHIVNRKYPDKCTSIPIEQEIISLFYVKFTNCMIANTDICTTKYTTDFEIIKEEKTLCEKFDVLCIDEDSAVIALSHTSGKISVIWTSSWKTHHTLRSPPILNMDINSNKLVGITKNTRNIYIWDLVCGSVIVNLISPWNKPEYIYINNDINTFGITTIDTDNNLISTYEISKKPSFKEWSTFEVSPTVHIITVSKIPYKINSMIVWNDIMLLNADGYFMKIKYSLNSLAFQWPMQALKWIKDPAQELYLTPLADSKGKLPENVNNIMLKHMDKIVDNLFESIIANENICKWSINKLIKNKTIHEKFIETLNYQIIELYTGNTFEDREIVYNIITFMRSMNIDIIGLTEILPFPKKLSEFVFWISLFKYFTKWKEIIESRTGLCEHIYDVFKDSSGEIRICSAELLILLNKFIKDWKKILKNTSVFEFVKPNIVKTICKKGYTSDWIYCFMNAHDKKYMNNNVKLCWKELTEWVLNVNELQSYNYPNPNDGHWERKSVEEIVKGSWVSIEEVIQHFELPTKDYSGPSHLKCWVQNKEGYANSIERALTILDKDIWNTNEKWKLWDKTSTISNGSELNTKYGLGTIVNWPLAFMKSGATLNITDIEDDIFYRLPSEKFFIPIKLKIKAEEYIKTLIMNDDLPYIPNHSKTIILDILYPQSITNIHTVETVTDVSAFKLCYDHLWLGTYTGDIIVMETVNINSRQNNILELLSSHIQKITSIDSNYNNVVSSSMDGVVCVWDIKTFKRVITYTTTDDSAITGVIFTDEKTIWMITNKGNVYAWNFIMDTLPITIHKDYKTSFKTCIATRGNYVLTGSSKLRLWYKEYPQHINLVKHVQVSCLCILSGDSFLTGSNSGTVKIYSKETDVTTHDIIWSDPTENVSSIYWISDSLNWCVLIGCQSGLLVLRAINSTHDIFRWKAPSGIMSITYNKPFIMVLTNDFIVYNMIYRDNQIKMSCEGLCKLIKKNDWKKFIKLPNKVSNIQNIIIQGFKNELCIDDFHEIIKICIDDEENRQEWCKKHILTILSIGAIHNRKKYQNLINRLFCFTGKRFKCMLCLGSSSSPKRFPITAINTCMHRFHTKCIKQHCQKNKEWDDECQQNWALHCTLKCPLCQEPFTKKNLVDDRYLTNMCKYISDDENDI